MSTLQPQRPLTSPRPPPRRRRTAAAGGGGAAARAQRQPLPDPGGVQGGGARRRAAGAAGRWRAVQLARGGDRHARHGGGAAGARSHVQPAAGPSAQLCSAAAAGGRGWLGRRRRVCVWRATAAGRHAGLTTASWRNRSPLLVPVTPLVGASRTFFLAVRWRALQRLAGGGKTNHGIVFTGAPCPSRMDLPSYRLCCPAALLSRGYGAFCDAPRFARYTILALVSRLVCTWDPHANRLSSVFFPCFFTPWLSFV